MLRFVEQYKPVFARVQQFLRHPPPIDDEDDTQMMMDLRQELEQIRADRRAFEEQYTHLLMDILQLVRDEVGLGDDEDDATLA